MKKVIERMNNTVIPKNPSSPSSGKRRWLTRKFTGGEDKDKDKKGAASSAAAADAEDADEGGMRVDFYLVVFLKFIASIVPTIEVDSTTAF